MKLYNIQYNLLSKDTDLISFYFKNLRIIIKIIRMHKLSLNSFFILTFFNSSSGQIQNNKTDQMNVAASLKTPAIIILDNFCLCMAKYISSYLWHWQLQPYLFHCTEAKLTMDKAIGLPVQ